jgi:ribose transport system substrate-binding protein
MRRRRTMMKRRVMAALCVVLALTAGTAAGCGDDDDGGGGEGGQQAEDLTVGVSLASPTIPLYVAMAKGIRERAKQLGVEVTFTEANEDPVQQLNDVQDLIAQDVDGILISPIDAEAAVPAYEDARAAGITIMSIARNTSPELEDSFIGAPWNEFGSQIAKWICDHGGEGKKMAMIKGPAGASFVEDMEDGFKQATDQNCPSSSIAFENNNAPLSPDKGLASTQDAITADPDIDVFYANNDDLAGGVIQALEEKGVSMDEVIVTGFDGTPKGLEAAQAGDLDYTIALRPESWGRLGLETMVKSLRGESVPKLVRIETLPISEENAKEVTQQDIQ